jgi:hypothetical protein
MIKFLYILVIFLCLNNSIYTQNSGVGIQKSHLQTSRKIDKKNGTFGQTEQKRKGPIIKFKTTIYDFGTVNGDDVVQCNFVFYNKGDAPLLLKSVDAACGCTVPTWPKKPLMPGDSAVIATVFHPKSYEGQKVNKSITVQTYIKENGQDKIITLFIKGNVRNKQ